MFFILLAKRLAGKSLSNMTYFLSSGTLNLNSIEHVSRNWLYGMSYVFLSGERIV